MPIKYKCGFSIAGYVYDTETHLYYLQSRYYNPEIGRWISPEPNVYNGEFDEGSGLIGYNVYVYCANSPVNCVDPFGEDAIWLQDKDNVLGFGHTGLLIQDDRGVWYHFYWGNNGTGIFRKQKVSASLQKLVGFSYSDLSVLNDYLIEHSVYTPNDKKVSDGNPYEDAIYFRGDFTASVKYADRLTRNYHLLLDNCMQLSAEVLSKGRFEQNHKQYKSYIRYISYIPIPNYAYVRLQSFNSFMMRYHSLK